MTTSSQAAWQDHAECARRGRLSNVLRIHRHVKQIIRARNIKQL